METPDNESATSIPGNDRPNKLIVLCDGTWCGTEADTKSNIHMLAKAIGISTSGVRKGKEVRDLSPARDGVKARYFAGIGLGGTFLEYLFNGATANDIGDECRGVYTYIAENYDDTHEIWMFGLSRGAFTVRCVAGMINNCGIINSKKLAPAETAILCKEVYNIYRSPYDQDHPSSDQIRDFRNQFSWNVKTPVKFMGIVDTVGSLGIPRMNAGIGIEWPEFHDQKVSGEVEKVYHAMSMHDRLWWFEPCLALRDKKHDSEPELQIHEKWFPGVHYDLGRQKFRFLRAADFSWIPEWLNEKVYPNEVLSDLVLKWILESIKAEDPSGKVIHKIDEKIKVVIENIKNPGADVGSGDVYDNILEYVPFAPAIRPAVGLGEKAVSIEDEILPKVHLGSHIESALGSKVIKETVLAVKDRRIPSPDADTYPYKDADRELDGRSIYDLARIGPGGHRKWYRSQTYEAFRLCQRARPPAPL